MQQRRVPRSDRQRAPLCELATAGQRGDLGGVGLGEGEERQREVDEAVTERLDVVPPLHAAGGGVAYGHGGEGSSRGWGGVVG